MPVGAWPSVRGAAARCVVRPAAVQTTGAGGASVSGPARPAELSGGGPGMGGKPTNEGPDFGLLVTVAQTGTEADAGELRRRLSANGIRSTVAPGTDGRTRILVFRENAARARRLVGGGARDSSAD